MTYLERRAAVLKIAETLDGYGHAKHPSDHHIGRVLMTRKYGHRAGFYPTTSAAYSQISAAAAHFQRAQTRRLSK